MATDATALYNDGAGTDGVPHGIPVTTVTIATVAYVVEGMSPDAPTKIIQQYDANGNPSGQVIQKDFRTCGFTLQLAETGTALPLNGATFQANPFKDTTGPYWIITKVSPKYGQNDAQLVDIDTVERQVTPA